MKTQLIGAGLLAVFVIGCDVSPKSGRGFTLPEGDMEAGKATFQRLQCDACHQIEGIEQRQPAAGSPPTPIVLGGEVTRIQTYGELVTSIINPSHRFAQGYPLDEMQSENGESRMTNYNDVMTVRELMDLVAFLQSKYTLRAVQPTPYVPYY